MWNKKAKKIEERFSEIETRINQIECPHDNIDVIVNSWLNERVAVCRDCGKTIQEFDTKLEAREYEKKMVTDKHKKQEIEHKKLLAKIDNAVKACKDGA